MCSIRNVTPELLDKLPSDFRLRILRNKEKLAKCQNCMGAAQMNFWLALKKYAKADI